VNSIGGRVEHVPLKLNVVGHGGDEGTPAEVPVHVGRDGQIGSLPGHE